MECMHKDLMPWEIRLVTNSELILRVAYSQAKPRVKYFSDDKFIIIWESFKQDGSGYGMYGRYFQFGWDSKYKRIPNQHLQQLITNGMGMLKYLMMIHLLLYGAVGNKMVMTAEFMFKDLTHAGIKAGMKFVLIKLQLNTSGFRKLKNYLEGMLQLFGQVGNKTEAEKE
ncbi:MAG: hypothetical protein MZV64_58675 [Ignavibacteriales bacterium]|nr:hypothetical protein [Ignavibacteriales bacterium]